MKENQVLQNQLFFSLKVVVRMSLLAIQFYT